mgnify:CR=1 FL=1
MNERRGYVISNLSDCKREVSLQREACSFCVHNEEVHSSKLQHYECTSWLCKQKLQASR